MRAFGIAAPAQPHEIEAEEMRAMPARERERDDVALDPRQSRDKDVGADARLLMDRRAAADHHIVADLHMASEQHAVRKNDPVAEPAVMRDMRIGEQRAAVADARFRTALARAGVDRDALANDAVGADDEPPFPLARSQILRACANRSEREDFRARP